MCSLRAACPPILLRLQPECVQTGFAFAWKTTFGGQMRSVNDHRCANLRRSSPYRPVRDVLGSKLLADQQFTRSVRMPHEHVPGGDLTICRLCLSNAKMNSAGAACETFENVAEGKLYARCCYQTLIAAQDRLAATPISWQYLFSLAQYSSRVDEAEARSELCGIGIVAVNMAVIKESIDVAFNLHP